MEDAALTQRAERACTPGDSRRRRGLCAEADNPSSHGRVTTVGTMDRFEARLQAVASGIREVINRAPLPPAPPLPPQWLRCEMLERWEVLERTDVEPGASILEVGSGAHALATVPLAYRVGPLGRVVAAERSRWGQFRTVVLETKVGDRIRPVTCDARRLPLRDDCVDLAVCLHGIRSFRGEENTVRILQEMLRVAPRLLLAESLPIARSDAQRAHLTMYDLRHDVFFASSGVEDDLPYFSLDRLTSLAVRAGAVVESTETLDVDLPHSLAYFPRTVVEAIAGGEVREELLRRWDHAAEMLRRYGEDHPPVGVIAAHRQ